MMERFRKYIANQEMEISILGIILLIVICPPSFSQFSKIHGFVETGILGGTGGSLPFWMLSNHYGRFTPTSENGYLDAGIFSDTLKQDQKFGFDWGGEAFGRYDGAFKGWLHQGYIGGKAGFLYCYAGLKEEHFGSQDPELSSGFVIWSGNARPIPKLSLATLDFVKVPYTKGFVEIKGGISHGWFGKDGYVKHAYLHHKYLYLRFGGSHAFHFTAGLHHFAQWGGISPEYGELPSSLKDFFKVFFAKKGGDTISGVPYNEWENRFGNHLGTKDISLDYSFRGELKIKAYWQNFIEYTTGLGFKNVSDGLWGIQLEHPGKLKIGYEFFRSITRLYTKDGKPWRGEDNYFNNSIYQNGWTFKGYTIGTPIITSPILTHQQYPGQITNNRVVGHIVHVEFFFNKNRLNMRYSFTKNYGDSYILFDPPKKQHSLLLSLQKSVLSDRILGMASFGWDQGEILGNHVGGGLGMRYRL
jgi:hypothetical protein